MEKVSIGIDEVGRGPLAGPVSVGLFATIPKYKAWILKNIFNNKLKDSKKLSEKRREEIYQKLKILKNKGKVDFYISHNSANFIDKKGISKAIENCVKSGLNLACKKLSEKMVWPKPALQRARRTEDLFEETFFAS